MCFWSACHKGVKPTRQRDKGNLAARAWFMLSRPCRDPTDTVKTFGLCRWQMFVQCSALYTPDTVMAKLTFTNTIPLGYVMALMFSFADVMSETMSIILTHMWNDANTPGIIHESKRDFSDGKSLLHSTNLSKDFEKLVWGKKKKTWNWAFKYRSAIVFEMSIVLLGKETVTNMTNGNCSRCHLNELLDGPPYSPQSLSLTSWVVLKKDHVTIYKFTCRNQPDRRSF